MEIEVFLCRSDNYGLLIRDPATGKVACIDACDAAAYDAELQRRGWKLDTILVTHRHGDHIEGIPALVGKYGAEVIAPRLAKADVPGAARYVGEGDRVMVGALAAEVWDTPGHCADHVAYYFAGNGAIIVGDTLFVMGCGRILDSTAEKLHTACQRIAALPGSTRIYCGHEYTISNARFGVHIEPANEKLRTRLAAVEAARAAGEFTVPTTVAEERDTNVFVRARDAAEFAARREAKNRF